MMRTLFAALDREEEAAAAEAAESHTPLPSFGDSKSDPKHDVRQFYLAWIAFSTAKSFSWLDHWKYSDAPDRRVKRAMEKENKRYRDAGRREYNDTVKVNRPVIMMQNVDSNVSVLGHVYSQARSTLRQGDS